MWLVLKGFSGPGQVGKLATTKRCAIRNKAIFRRDSHSERVRAALLRKRNNGHVTEMRERYVERGS